MGMKNLVLGLIFILSQYKTSAGDDFCAGSNFTFMGGEKVVFKVFCGGRSRDRPARRTYLHLRAAFAAGEPLARM